MQQELSLDFSRRSDLRLIELAIKRGFDIPIVVREKGAQAVAAILVSPTATNREKLRAFSVLVAAEQVNVQLALKAIDKRFPDKIELTDERTPAILELVEELRNDPEYVEYQRARALSSDTQPGAVSANSDPRISDGAARGAVGPEANGAGAEED